MLGDLRLFDRKEYQNRYRESHKEEMREYGRQYYTKNREQELLKQKQYRNENREYVRRQSKSTDLKRRFGLSIEEYDRMFKEQNGVCAICKQPEIVVSKTNNKLRDLAVDHDPETGKVRSLLCQRHNTALGQFYDDPELLEEGATYIRRHKGFDNGGEEHF